MASRSKGNKGSKSSFKQQLKKEELDFFNKVADLNFKGQAIAFLNAYWNECATQAPFIFHVSYRLFREAEFQFSDCEYMHKYNEGKSLDFDAGLYFFEQICKYTDKTEYEYSGKAFKPSVPQMMTSIARKKELRNKVDVNFDGRVSFLEYLLYQYQEFANPDDFCTRSMHMDDEPEEVRKARVALEDVNKKIRVYEARKQKLTEKSKTKGVKGLGAKNELEQLSSGPLAGELNTLLITAEAAVRIAMKKYKIRPTTTTPGGQNTKVVQTNGSVFWLQTDLDDKKSKYGKKKK